MSCLSHSVIMLRPKHFQALPYSFQVIYSVRATSHGNTIIELGSCFYCFRGGGGRKSLSHFIAFPLFPLFPSRFPRSQLLPGMVLSIFLLSAYLPLRFLAVIYFLIRYPIVSKTPTLFQSIERGDLVGIEYHIDTVIFSCF